jgi:5-oxoprolinase (ATP-hydrolysing) subunit C
VIEVLEPGPLTSVQTARGRPGWRHLGIGVGGAADAWSARLANRLVGNSDQAAVLEMTLAGPTLRFGATGRVAVAGAPFEAFVDGLPLPAFSARDVRSGSTVRIGGGDGARAYLAVGGGIVIEPVLGSAATDLRSGFGGHDGRALRAGDSLTFGPVTGPGRRWTGTRPRGPIRVVDGPQADRLAADALTAEPWTVSNAADRSGVRLDGPALRPTDPEVASMGLPNGAIQVPPDGRPIVMLADRPVTGGYPVPACVIGADIGRVAQLRPGDAIGFVSVSLEEAREASRRAEEELAALVDADAPPDDELGWAGALE